MHTINIQAYMSAGKSPENEPLVRLYCLLVATEISLKDLLPSWLIGHNIEDLLQKACDAKDAESTPPVNRSCINSLVIQLNSELVKLSCTGKEGVAKFIKPSNYPEIRYVHFSLDFPESNTDNTVINGIITIVNDIHTEMQKQGMRI